MWDPGLLDIPICSRLLHLYIYPSIICYFCFIYSNNLIQDGYLHGTRPPVQYHVIIIQLLFHTPFLPLFWLISEASPQWGGGWKTLHCCTCPYVVYIRWPTWLIVVRKGCWSFIQTELVNSSAHWHWLWYKFLIIGTIFNLAKVNTFPCICEAALSLSESEQMAE